ncbi:MAG TPA: DUF5995 family protein [Thermoleophilaceae bacterium]|nr:DUF5995 family protein [Thermoleophilaceae bacterium]
MADLGLSSTGVGPSQSTAAELAVRARRPRLAASRRSRGARPLRATGIPGPEGDPILPPCARVGSLGELLEWLSVLEDALEPTDGVRWFVRLYREASAAVAKSLEAGDMEDPPFLEALGVHCGNAFLAALDAAERGGNVPDAWEPIFDARAYTSVAPLQFAIAGLNAHVNRDLALGLCAGWIAADGEPDPAGPRGDDYRRLNELIGAALEEIKPWLLTGAVAGLDHVLGMIDDRVALWSVARAREAAWTHATVLWHLRERSVLNAAYAATLDRTTGLAGRLLTVPLPID